MGKKKDSATIGDWDQYLKQQVGRRQENDFEPELPPPILVRFEPPTHPEWEVNIVPSLPECELEEPEWRPAENNSTPNGQEIDKDTAVVITVTVVAMIVVWLLDAIFGPFPRLF